MEDIRYATAADTGAIFDLLKLMHAEVGLAAMSEPKVRERIHACLDGGMIIVATEGDRVVGTMGIVLMQPWYSDEWIASETWTFVHPEHRRSRHIRNLLEGAKLAAKRVGLSLTVAVTSDKRTLGKCRLFARHMTPVGQIFLQRAA